MDPFSLLFIAMAIYGGLHAMKNGVKVARASAALSRTSAQGRLPKNSPKSIMADTRRRATASWWAREAAGGFPVTLGGMKQGWHAHQTAAAKHEADATVSRAKMLEQVARHRDRTRKAQKRIDAATPPAPPVQAPTAGAPGHPVMSPPPPAPNGSPAPARPVNGQAPINQTPGGTVPAPGPDCTDPDCKLCHPKQSASGGAPAQPSASPNGGQPVAGSDTTYDSAIATCEQVKTKIDEMVNDSDLSVAEQLADSLGPMFPDDSESLGAAGDLVSALQAVKAAQQAAIEAAGVLQDTIRKNHEAANEAAKATGHMAERQFHGAS